MSQVITLTKYKGGQGASVAAAVLSHVLQEHARIVLISDTFDALAALGLSMPSDDYTPNVSNRDRAHRLDFLRVGDTDTSDPIAKQVAQAINAEDVPTLAVVDLPPALMPSPDEFRAWSLYSVAPVLVCRPDYLALRSTVAETSAPPTVLTFDEPERALSARDVQTVLRNDAHMVAPWSPAFARAIDAGLLTYRLDTMRDGLQYLDALAPLIRSAREWLHALTV